MEEILKLFGGAENIWAAIRNSASKLGIESTRIMLELFYVLKNPETSVIDKTLIVTALGYQLLPEDVLPRDKYGILGFLDNFVTIGFAYSKVKSSITPQIETQVNNILGQWFGEIGNDTHDNIPIDEFQPPVQPIYHPEVQTNQQLPSYNPSQQNKPVWDDEDVVID